MSDDFLSESSFLKIECTIDYHLNQEKNVEFLSSSKIHLENENQSNYEFDEIKATYRLHLNSNETSSSRSTLTSLTSITNITSLLSEINSESENNKPKIEITKDDVNHVPLIKTNQPQSFKLNLSESKIQNSKVDRNFNEFADSTGLINLSFEEESKIINTFEEYEVNDQPDKGLLLHDHSISSVIDTTETVCNIIPHSKNQNSYHRFNNSLFINSEITKSESQKEDIKLKKASNIFRDISRLKIESTESNLNSMINKMDEVLESLLSEENNQNMHDNSHENTTTVEFNDENFHKVLKESDLLNDIYTKYEKSLEKEKIKLKRRMAILERRMRNIQRMRSQLMGKKNFLLDAFKFERNLVLNTDQYLNIK